jgi:hypothetical protein
MIWQVLQQIFGTINSHESFKSVLIGASGASCHYCNNDEVLFEQTTISEMITFGNGSKLKVDKVGKL